jgi:ribosomal protein S18 acetylase RimI-like enzyme
MDAFETVLAETGDAATARRILDDLPAWFGDARAKEHYIAATASLPVLVARRPGGTAVGFLSLKLHSEVAAEVFVLGVLRAHHRSGCGRALIGAAAAHLAAEGFRFLTVKTLAADNPDPGYRDTRHFYAAMGFQPLEVFPALWGEALPCLMMIRELRSALP